MFVAFLIVVGISAMLWAIHYEKRRRREWTALGSGIWMQRRTTKYKAHFVFRTAGEIDASAWVPALWEVQHPFGAKPKYITQHVQQLQAWWEPLAKQFSQLGHKSKTIQSIKSVQFAPSLGIYMQVDAAKNIDRLPEEGAIVHFLDTARQTWNPTRHEVDNSYPIRQSMLDNAPWMFWTTTLVLVYGMLKYNNTHFFNDGYYIGMGSVMALVSSLALVFWFYPKMQGSVYRFKALTQMALACTAALCITFPYMLVAINMASPTVVCDMSAPVVQWYSRSGKTRRYYATVDLRQCAAPIVQTTNVKVQVHQYQKGTTLPIKVSKGILNRYYLETK